MDEQRQNSRSPLNVVTGAFGYSGRYLAARLLAMGERVKTLTGHPRRSGPLSAQIEAAPFNFERPDELVRNLQGASTLYNTYWVRFSHGGVSHAMAVANTRTLVGAAAEAGIRRIVHLSITNPSLDSPLPYFRGKAELEEVIKASSLSYAILRPTVIFGREDILINNIAWLLRHFPVFAVPGGGDYKVQPVFVEDLAALAVESGHRRDNLVMDAVGPEIYTYDELVRLIAAAVGSRARVVHLSPGVVVVLSRLLGALVKDVVLTRDEVEGLMANLLFSQELPTGHTRLSSWLQDNAKELGSKYASELQRHYHGSRMG